MDHLNEVAKFYFFQKTIFLKNVINISQNKRHFSILKVTNTRSQNKTKKGLWEFYTNILAAYQPEGVTGLYLSQFWTQKLKLDMVLLAAKFNVTITICFLDTTPLLMHCKMCFILLFFF